MKCPRCGTTVYPFAKYCCECGARLTVVTLADLRKYERKVLRELKKPLPRGCPYYTHHLMEYCWSVAAHHYYPSQRKYNSDTPSIPPEAFYEVDKTAEVTKMLYDVLLKQTECILNQYNRIEKRL